MPTNNDLETTIATDKPAGSATQTFKDSAQSLKDTAADKARTYATDGKSKVTGALDNFSKVINDTAGSIDEKLGAEYGKYARQAADAVSGFATKLDAKNVDEIFDDVRTTVRKSPVAAIGIAAAVGFALTRLVKAGGEDTPKSES